MLFEAEGQGLTDLTAQPQYVGVSVRLGAQAGHPRNTSGPSTSDSSAQTIYDDLRISEAACLMPELHEVPGTRTSLGTSQVHPPDKFTP